VNVMRLGWVVSVLLLSASCFDFDGAYQSFCADGRCDGGLRDDAGGGSFDGGATQKDAGAIRDGGTPTDAGAFDSGSPDAGGVDAGVHDAGIVVDAGNAAPDGGGVDAGSVIDAGSPPVDAGCASALCLSSIFAAPTKAMWAISGTSAADVWATGRSGTWAHFDGSAWSAGAEVTTTMTLWACSVSENFVWAGSFFGVHRRPKTGGSWALRFSSGDDSVAGVFAPNDSQIFATGSTYWLAVGDGTTWVDEYRLTTAPSGQLGPLNSIHGAGGSFWVVGAYNAGDGVIARRADAGVWLSEVIPTTDELNAVFALDAVHAWAVGESGVVLSRSSTGTWVETAPRFTNEALRAVWASRTDDVWVGGNGGTFWRFDGLTWSQLQPPGLHPRMDIEGITGFGDRDLFVVANYNTGIGSFGAQFDGGHVMHFTRE